MNEVVFLMADDKHRPPEPPPASLQERPEEARSDEGLAYPQGEPIPGGPEGPQPPAPAAADARQLRSAQNFILAASILGPVSLILASFFLSAAGIVCAFIGFRKLKALAAMQTAFSPAAVRMKRAAIIAISVCGVAAALNLILVWMLFPTVMEHVEAGDYGNLFSGNGTGSGPETNSTWG